MEKIKKITILFFFLIISFSVFAQNLGKEWAGFIYNISDNISCNLASKNANFQILVLGSKEIEKELSILINNGQKFQGKEAIIKNEMPNVSASTYSPDIIYIDKSGNNIMFLGLVSKKYPTSLILTNIHDSKKSYKDMRRLISVFIYGAHIRSIGNPNISFEFSRANINSSTINTTTTFDAMVKSIGSD